MQRRNGGINVFGPYKHGDRWRVILVGGDGPPRYRSFATRALADTYAESARNETQGRTVSAAIEAYLEFKRSQGRAPLTIVAYEQRLEQLLAEHLTRPLRSVAGRGTELYTAVIAGRGVDSHQNLLVAGRLWARWCVKQRWLRADPFAEVEAVGQRVHGADKERLTTDQSRRLEAWCLAHPADQGAVLTLGYLYLGPRNTELARRNVQDLDDDGRVLDIGRTKTRAGRRKLRIPEALSDMLRAMVAGRAPDAPMFTAPAGGRMDRNAARKLVRATCKAAGVPVLPPQALRRTQASLATEAGETALAVAHHLGHAIGAAPKVTGQAYIERDAAVAAQGERALRVLQGGRR